MKKLWNKQGGLTSKPIIFHSLQKAKLKNAENGLCIVIITTTKLKFVLTYNLMTSLTKCITNDLNCYINVSMTQFHWFGSINLTHSQFWGLIYLAGQVH